MHAFRNYFVFELKKVFCRKKSIFILLIFCLALFFLQNGISHYKNVLIKKKIFKNVEKLKVSQFISYRQYGAYGFRVLFVPSPFSVYFTDSGVIPDMTSYVDGGERLKIYHPLKGKNIFEQKKYGFTDFSGIVLFFGMLLTLLYAYDSFRKEDYLKYLATLSKPGLVFFSIFVSRLFIMFLLLLALIFSSFFLVAINGIHIPLDIHLFYFIMAFMVVTTFFFALGSVISTIDKKVRGISILICCWFFLLFMLPETINQIVAGRSDQITPVYKLEMEKLKTIMDFEKKAIEEAGTFNYGKKVNDTRRKVIIKYLNNEFKKIEKLEESMRAEMNENISRCQWLSTFFPTTFYRSVTDEISSRGYENLIEFYKHVQKLKRKFVKWYIDKVFFSNFTKVESFIKDEENVFYAQTRMPGYILMGDLLNLVYIVILIWFSYIRYKKILYKEPEKEITRKDKNPIALKKGDHEIILVRKDDFKNRMYNLLSGKRSQKTIKDFKGIVSIESKDIVTGTEKFDFFYLCSSGEIPEDIKAGDFITLISRLTHYPKNQREAILEDPKISTIRNKTFSQLEDEDKSEILFHVLKMKKSEVYLVNDTCKWMPEAFVVKFSNLLDTYASKGAIIIYITTQQIPETLFEKGSSGFSKSLTWKSVVNEFRREHRASDKSG